MTVEKATLAPRARFLLAAMRGEPSHYDVRPCSIDGEWFHLNRMPNIGKKTINELLEAGLIEARPDRFGGNIYRCRGPQAERSDLLHRFTELAAFVMVLSIVDYPEPENLNLLMPEDAARLRRQLDQHVPVAHRLLTRYMTGRG